MYDRLTILHLVREAQRETPTCACGAPMVPVDRDGGLWLECSAPGRPREGLLARLASLDWVAGHRRREILAEEDLLAA
jgi:hypothetical protein